jgi:HPt (histidine-containing phosphotransfer) domain-containing protein
MAKDKAGKPSVATYSDYELITPPNRLRMAISHVSDKEALDDPVKRAEAALAALASEFASWMDSECDRLDQARKAIKAKGFSKATQQSLFHAAHDIKGEAATFGYPFVAASADSLCRLLEHTPDATRIPIALIDQHVDAVRAIIREKARPDIEQIADQLTRKLREVSDEFLARENKDRPDVLADILAPSLAPGEQST